MHTKFILADSKLVIFFKHKIMSIQTINPATNKVVKSFEEMTDKQVEQSLEQSDITFHEWKKTSYPERAAVLNKVASLMREKKTALATLITLEMGKIFSQAVGEVELSANILEYYAKNGETFLADKK